MIKKHPTTTNGFSLIELLVVLVILALLAGIVGPRLIKHIGKAKSDTARLQIKQLGSALDSYYLEIGEYPTSEQGLSALVVQPDGVKNWNGPYLKKKQVPLDPWNRKYHYVYPGTHGLYDLFSLGKDNKEGGQKEDADIVNWE